MYGKLMRKTSIIGPNSQKIYLDVPHSILYQNLILSKLSQTWYFGAEWTAMTEGTDMYYV